MTTAAPAMKKNAISCAVPTLKLLGCGSMLAATLSVTSGHAPSARFRILLTVQHLRIDQLLLSLPLLLTDCCVHFHRHR